MATAGRPVGRGVAVLVGQEQGRPRQLTQRVEVPGSSQIARGGGHSSGTLGAQAAWRVQEVRGEGVVGEQPVLSPGGAFRYTSAAMIETPVGSMHGSYEMLAEDGVRFDAAIPAFGLSVPNLLH